MPPGLARVGHTLGDGLQDVGHAQALLEVEAWPQRISP